MEDRFINVWHTKTPKWAKDWEKGDPEGSYTDERKIKAL